MPKVEPQNRRFKIRANHLIIFFQLGCGEIRDEDLRGIFREFDLNGDGFIQKDELKAVMVKMGQCPTDEELNAMFIAADKDRDGNIDFNGFFFLNEYSKEIRKKKMIILSKNKK